VKSRTRLALRKTVLRTGGILLVALLLGGCETDGGVAARAREKPAAYAALNPWQKRFVAKGVVAAGFTPDVVYIAMGRPDTIEKKDLPAGHAELWTWKRYYPNIDAVHGFRHQPFTTESAYQPQMSREQTVAGEYPNDLGAEKVPLGMDRNGGESIGKTGGPQGGSMEPATLQSYTMQVLFQNGRAAKMAAIANMN